MSEGQKSPMFWFAVCGIILFALGYVFKGMGREPVLALISSLSFGFFGGSMGYSVASLLQSSSSQNAKTNAAMLITISVLMGLIGGAYYVLNGNIPKALEVGAIVAGLAALIVGHFIEEKIGK
jgi:hypothetical protein